jgi:hypothetical protein
MIRDFANCLGGCETSAELTAKHATLSRINARANLQGCGLALTPYTGFPKTQHKLGMAALRNIIPANEELTLSCCTTA